MSIKIQVCILLECNGCGTGWWDHGDYTPHYTTAAEALKDIAELEWRVDGEDHWCPRCAAKQDCQRNGHLMSEWQTTTHTTADGNVTYLWRYCAHCDQAYEKAAFDTIPTL